MKFHKRSLRLLVQYACLAAAIVLLWPLLPWVAGPRFVTQTSPFVAICSGIATRTVGFGTAIGLVLAAMTIGRRRWYCRYICPTGLVLEGVTRLGLKKTSWWTRWPPLGKYAAIVTLVGAVVGYPVLLWMDPIAIFSSPFVIRGAGDFVSGVMAGLGLSVLLVATLFMGMVWCVRICPLGGIQDLLDSLKSLKLLSRFRSRKPAPVKSPPSVVNAKMPVARRTLLVGAVGAGLGLWARKSGAARGEEAPLRPPGAAPEDRFAGLCIRCGNCTHACPSKIIHPDVGQAGLAGLLAPVVRYDRMKYCLETCNACTQVCPSGALQALDMQQKRWYVIGEALVDTSLCLLTLGKKECDACLRACPFDAVRIRWDQEQYLAYPVIDPKKCNGCGACEIACPTKPFKAIRVWKTEPTIT
jgi:ferredoxin-type protein NapF